MESFEDFGQNLIIRVFLMSIGRFVRTRVQSHCLTFDPGPSLYDSFKHLKSTRSFVTKFHMKPPWAEGRKVCSNSPLGHMSNMAAMPVNVKNL